MNLKKRLALGVFISTLLAFRRTMRNTCHLPVSGSPLTAWTGMHRNSTRDFTVERCTSIRAERRMKRF